MSYSVSDFNMDKLVQLNNQAAGRDKIARLIQYSSRALWDALEKTHTNPNLVHQFKTIEYILSTFRKRKYFLWIFPLDVQQICFQFSDSESASTFFIPH